MRHTHKLARRASFALVAIAALGTTSLTAQDAASPASQTAAQQAPMVLIPQEIPTPIIADQAPAGNVSGPISTLPEAAPVNTSITPLSAPAQPIIQPIAAEPVEPIAAPTLETTTERTSASTQASQPQLSSSANTQAAAAVSNGTSATPSTDAAPLAAPSVSGEEAQTNAAPVAASAIPAESTANSNAAPGTSSTILISLLAALALGIGGMALFMRRRRVTPAKRPDQGKTIVAKNIDDNRQPSNIAPENTVGTHDEPLVTTSTGERGEAIAPTGSPEMALARDTHSEPAAERGVENKPTLVEAPVPLPTEMPETFEERDEVLHRLIKAEPDRANPFRSLKARSRRARLILQSLGRDFRNSKPRIDLSQYTKVWPALRGWEPATA